jgi:3-oxoadipate enol-lactonase
MITENSSSGSNPSNPQNDGMDKHIIINGLSVSYHDIGREDAPAIVLIHGFPLNKSMWNSQMELLKNDFRVIAYDVRGHGNSETGSQDFSIELFVNDLLCLIETLGLQRVILFGFSMGGYIALNAIEKHADRFDGLILSDTQCTADAPEARAKRIGAMDRILEDGVAAYADEILPKLFAPASFVRHRTEVAAVREMILNTSTESLCNTLFAMSARKETRSELMEIGIPTLILVGKEDEITPVAASQVIHSRIRGSSFAVIPHAGHLANMENPVVYNQYLTEFLFPFLQVRLRADDLSSNDSERKSYH